MTEITFLLNGETVRVCNEPPTRTLLEWLRDARGLNGTKEGCNEGDCGACTVMVTDPDEGAQALNACILFLPQLHGKAVRTVEGVAKPNGQPHPVQAKMVKYHGSQCGFCTPGFVMSMVVAHLQKRTDHDDVLAGNLCRCTGYAPIVRAAETASDIDWPPHWLIDGENLPSVVPLPFQPLTADELATWYEAHPEATLVAGATDVGLWVTKGLQDLREVAFLNRCRDLQRVEVSEETIRIGAGVTMATLMTVLREHHPSYFELVRRYGSEQVRQAATIGGNIANGSPIGDNPPALIALGATLHLRKGSVRRDLRLEDFFLDYNEQDLQAAEFVEAVSFPRQSDRLRCYKLSKRFDQDISAVCGCFSISVENGTVASARIAFGGMAGIPKRAAHVEQALAGAEWTQETIDASIQAFDEDFAPLTDIRASAAYRLAAAKGMLQRYFLEDAGVPVNVLEVTP